MRFLAVNGSPRGPKSNTDRILLPFLEGAREAGAETEVVYLKGKHIEHCLGCFSCWIKTPGVCVHKDDMPELIQKVRGADVLVFATPLYVFTVSGLMKDFMDRMAMPLLQPFIIQRGDQYLHPRRYEGGSPGQYVLISNCGFPERQHFSGLVETFRCFTSGPDSELAGAICCAGGELLRQPALQDSLTWYADAARKAGREVAEQGSISPQTQEVLDRPLIEDPAVYANMANMRWRSSGVEMIETAGARSSGASQLPAGEFVPLPPPQSLDSMRDLVAGMAVSYNPAEGGDLEATIQFHVTGDGAGSYFLDISGGSCMTYEGEHPEPTLTIDTPTDVWMAISRGEMNGATAMLTGKYSIKGKMGLMMRFDKLFSGLPGT